MKDRFPTLAGVMQNLFLLPSLLPSLMKPAEVPTESPPPAVEDDVLIIEVTDTPSQRSKPGSA